MKLIYILIAMAICAGGCKKFLEESPYSFVATENFYKTAADAELALTGVYDILNATTVQGQGNNNMWSRGMQFMTSTGCDELIGDPTKNNSDNNYITIANYTYTGENALVQNAYAFMYAGINRANYIIEKVPGIAMDAVRREQIIGEARLLKGIFYFYLGWLYGGVPLVNSTSVDLKAPRNSLEIVMKQAESDLQFAYQKLPARNSQAGRVNKYTAEGFLIKLYTYLASCRENNVGEALNFPLNSFEWVDKTAMYNQALQLCTDMYTQSGYTLIRPYAHLFLAATEELARNEHLFVVQASATEYIYYFNLAGPTGNYLTVGGTAGWLRPVREGYLRLNANDGRRASFSGNIASAGAPSTVINGFKY
jgi:hypothetical protein